MAKRKKVRRFEDIGKTLVLFGCDEKPVGNGKKYLYQGKFVWQWHYPSHTGVPDKGTLQASLKQIRNRGFGHMIEDLAL